MQKKITLVLGFLFTILSLFSQGLYDINNITIIELTFDDPDWDQTLDTNYANDLDERLLATCIVNGVPFDSVGVKYKGNSTYDPNNDKNPLNIKLDYIIGNQDYDGWYTLKLSSGDKDPSFIREALSYEILRKYMVAPQSNFAKVYVNGDYYGLFTSNESVNKKFVADYFYSDKDNTLVKCNWEVFQDGGSSLEYLGPDSTAYFTSYDLRSDHGLTDIVNLTDYIENDFDSIEDILNIDRTIWMLAFNNVLVNLDSYSGPFKQNYYLYKDDHHRMNAVVWDLNMSFGGFRAINLGGGGPTTSQDLQEMDPLLRLGNNTYPLIDMLLSDVRYRKMYIAHCRTMLEENFLVDLYYERAEILQDFIYNDYDSDPNQIFSTAQFESNLNTTISVGGGPGNGPYIGLSELMDGRTDYLLGHPEFQKSPPIINDINVGAALPNTTVNITVDVLDATYVYLGYRNSIAEPFAKVEMYDDGNHNDGSADDGIYGTNIDVGASDVQYYIYADNDEAGLFSPVRAEHEYHDLAVTGDLVINEFMASNDATQADQDGEHDDWIELYNNTSSTIDISGYYLSDDVDDRLKWSLPNGSTIEANGYLVIWADDDINQSGLHASFKLSASGEAIYLSDSSGELVDEVVFPKQTTDVSYGRFPNGIGAFTTMLPTFNGENMPQTTPTTQSEMLKEVVLYPNPAKDYFTVSFDADGEVPLMVCNAMGQNIYKGMVEKGAHINTSTWPIGIYFVNIGDRNWRRVIKQ